MILPRPSNAGRWIPCPASPRLEASFPDPDGDDAKEGTAAHWVAAQVLGGHCELEELTDRKAPNGVIVTGEMVEHVQTYISTVRAFPIIERTINIWPGVEPGTPDALAVEGTRGYIWDFKYGYSIVEAPGNWQLACYAVGLFAKHEWNLESVLAIIVQPRPFHPDGRVRYWEISRDEAISLANTIRDAAANTQNPNAPVVTGSHCNHCNALHACEGARRAALNGVDIAYRNPPVVLQGADLAGELATLTRAAEAIKLRLDAIQSHAVAEIDANRPVPGWSLERSMGRRQWTDGVAALEALAGVSLTEIAPVSPAVAEKRGVDKALVKMFTTTRETGRKLVPRDASVKAAQVFK